MTKLVVVLDACVIIPMPLCDTLLRMVEANLFRFHISEQILEESTRNLAKILAKRQNITIEKALSKAQKRVEQIKLAFPESLVEPKQKIIDILTNDPKDRHVLATAIEAKASLIITANLKDFPDHATESYGIKAISPDDFLVTLLNLYGSLKIKGIIEKQAKTVNLDVNDILMNLKNNSNISKFVNMLS